MSSRSHRKIQPRLPYRRMASTSSEADNNEGNKLPFCDPKRSQQLLEVAYRSWKLDMYTDVTVCVGTERFKAHRLVLASVSDYFAPLFKVDEKNSGEVTLHNIEPEDFSVLLHFAYTGDLTISKENVQSILIAADYLSICHVKALCVQFIGRNLDNENVCLAFMFANAYSLQDLEHKALDFLKSNLDDVSKSASFFQLDPNFLVNILEDDNLIIYKNKIALKTEERELVILSSVMRYLTGRSEQDTAVVDMVVRCVRLPILPKEVVKKCLKNYKSFEKNTIVQNYVKLRDATCKYLHYQQPFCYLLVSSNSKATKDIPDTWLHLRKLAVFKMINGTTRYAAGGQVGWCGDPPLYLHNDHNLEISCIHILLREWDRRIVIGGLKVSYHNSLSDGIRKEDYIRGKTETEHEHHLVQLKPNEYIVKVIIGAGWLIDRLGFETNMGRIWGPYGGPGGSQYTENAPNGVLSYLHDINCNSAMTQGEGAIHNLMLRWIAFE